MTKNLTKEIRKSFINYFEKLDHTKILSAPLVPKNDPSLMFVNSGMAPLKEYFTGQLLPSSNRLVSCQRCIRAGGKHNDLENVGYTTRHHTFFEMLGNFSFGNYFKEDAIEYAWNFLTKELGIEKDKLYVTIYHEDEEAHTIWRNNIKLANERIFRVKSDDNFWSMAETGPCGPSSEIFYDYGDKYDGKINSQGVSGDRYVEIWNLVFMQFNRLADGTKTELPFKCIDTGIGLERLAAVLQGKRSNFETDIFEKLIHKINANVYGKSGDNSKKDVGLKVISDHMRTIILLMSEGLIPGSNGRRYVLRRIIRRAILYSYYIDEKAQLSKCLEPIFGIMAAEYEDKDYKIKNFKEIQRTIESEEENFHHNVHKGISLLDKNISSMATGEVIDGNFVFKLHDTYGFPYDLAKHKAEEKGLALDTNGFDKAMLEQKERSRKSLDQVNDIKKQISIILEKDADNLCDTVFCRDSEVESKILAIIIGVNEPDGTCRFEKTNKAEEETECIIVLDKTPFYCESGGQISDKKGKIEYFKYSDNGDEHEDKNLAPTLKSESIDERMEHLISFESDEENKSKWRDKNPTSMLISECELTNVESVSVKNPIKETNSNIYLHHVKIIRGDISVGDEVRSTIDEKLRADTAANHSATHILHHVLRKMFGTEVEQRGSFVSNEKLRFDFSCRSDISEENKYKIEDDVNNIIDSYQEVNIEESDSYEEAKSKKPNVVGIFEEVYGAKTKIRTVEIGESVEFCGGTHVQKTGDIRKFKILGITSKGAGVRRIEAITGSELYGYLEKEVKKEKEEKNEAKEENKKMRAKLEERDREIIAKSMIRRRFEVATLLEDEWGRIKFFLDDSQPLKPFKEAVIKRFKDKKRSDFLQRLQVDFIINDYRPDLEISERDVMKIMEEIIQEYREKPDIDKNGYTIAAYYGDSKLICILDRREREYFYQDSDLEKNLGLELLKCDVFNTMEKQPTHILKDANTTNTKSLLFIKLKNNFKEYENITNNLITLLSDSFGGKNCNTTSYNQGAKPVSKSYFKYARIYEIIKNSTKYKLYNYYFYHVENSHDNGAVVDHIVNYNCEIGIEDIDPNS